MSRLALRPSRSLVAALTAAVLGFGTITATATPVRADNYDTGRVIAGVTALAILGAAVNDAKQDRREAENRRRWEEQNHHRHQPRYQADRRKHAQGQCVRTRGGDIECGAPVRPGNNGWHNKPQPPRHGWHNQDPRRGNGNRHPAYGPVDHR